jgi:hypothetical protein
LTGKSDTIIKLNIKVQGFDLFSEQYFRRQYQLFGVSLKNVKIISQDNHLYGYLLTYGIGREIANQSGYLQEIYSVSPDTLFFRFEKKIPKTTPLNRAYSIPGTRVKLQDDTSHIRLDTLQNGAFRSDIKRNKKNK